MKVLHIINSLGTGGAEKLLLESLPIYNEKRIQSDLVLLNGTEQPFLKQLEEKKCCSVFKLSNGSVYNPFLIFKIIRYLKKYDIIHVHLFPALYWVAIAKVISFSSVKLVYTEHSTSNRRRNLFIFKILDRYVYGAYDKIIAITDEVSKLLVIHLNQNFSNKLIVINNGVNLEDVKKAFPYSKKDFFEDENSIISIQVSRFHPQKRQDTIIKAIKILPNQYKLLLVGDGELKKVHQEFVLKNKLEKRILFLGNRTDIPQLLKTSDLVILSSNYEGLSLSSIEGMASGKPFIASNVPGLQEMVANHGVLFDVGNEKDLANVILKLINDIDFYKITTEKCLKKASEYDINTMIEKYISLYNTITSNE